MTLFLIVRQENGPWAAISDVMLKSDGTEKSPNHLPFRFGAGSATPTVASGICSKSVLLENHILFWSGYKRDAEFLLNNIFNDKVPTVPEFKSRYNRIMHEFIGTLSVAYFCADGDINYGFSAHVKNFFHEGMEYIVGGSGRKDFRSDILNGEILGNKSEMERNPKEPLENRILERFIEYLHFELTDPFARIVDFGGAYEIFILQGGKFQRLPYTITEISNRDHFENLDGGLLGVTRHIDAMSTKDGTVFQLFLSKPGSHQFQDHILQASQIGSERNDDCPMEISVHFLYIITTQGVLFSMRDQRFGSYAWVNLDTCRLDWDSDELYRLSEKYKNFISQVT